MAGIFSDTITSLENSWELGTSGLKDLVSYAVGGEPHEAADAYARQVAAEKGLTPAEAARLQEQVRTAERQTLASVAPAPLKAERKAISTATKLVNAADNALDKGIEIPTWLWVGGGLAAACLVLYLGGRVVSVIRAVAP